MATVKPPVHVHYMSDDEVMARVVTLASTTPRSAGTLKDFFSKIYLAEAPNLCETCRVMLARKMAEIGTDTVVRRTYDMMMDFYLKK